jgi:hypothetical protein
MPRGDLADIYLLENLEFRVKKESYRCLYSLVA